MSTAFGLAMQISANTAQLATALAEVNKRLDSMGEAGKKAGDDLGTLKNIEIGKLALGGIKAVSGAFLTLSKSVLGAVESIVSFGKSVALELDNLNDVAARTGVNVEALQAYGAAAKLSGTDVETFAKSIQKLAVNIGKATDEKSAKKFTALGIAFEELKAATPTEQFEMVADALSRIAAPAERAAAAVKLFGKGGIELGPLFSEGPGALAKMREEAVALGQVVSEDGITAIDEMNKAFDNVWMTLKGITGQIVGDLAGPIADIAADLLNVVRSAAPGQIASSIAQGLLDFIDLAGTSFLNLAKFIDAFVRKFATILGIDMQSEAKKGLAALQKKEEGTRRTVNQGAFTSEVFTPGTLTEDEQRRKKELQQQIEAERSGTVYDVMRESLGSAVDKARAKLEERMNQPTLPQSGVAAVVADQEATAGATEQTKVLNEIARNTRPATTVELPR